MTAVTGPWASDALVLLDFVAGDGCWHSLMVAWWTTAPLAMQWPQASMPLGDEMNEEPGYFG